METNLLGVTMHPLLASIIISITTALLGYETSKRIRNPYIAIVLSATGSSIASYILFKLLMKK